MILTVLRYGLSIIGLFLVFVLVFKIFFQKYLIISQRLYDIQKSTFYADEEVSLTFSQKVDRFFESDHLFKIPFVGPRYEKKIKLLRENNLMFKPKEYVVASVVVPILLFFVSFLMLKSVWVSLGFAFIGSWSPNLYMIYLRNKRQVKIDEQLPSVLGILSNGLRAGLSLNQSIDVALGEMGEPLEFEFRRVLVDVGLGRSFEKALTDMEDRLQNENVTMFVTAVVIQRQIGGNLSEIIDLIAETIRGRLSLKRKVKTLMVQNKMSAVIIGLLPIILIVIMSVMSPGYLTPLYTDPIGQLASVVAIVMMIVGIVLLKRLIDLEV